MLISFMNACFINLWLTKYTVLQYKFWFNHVFVVLFMFYSIDKFISDNEGRSETFTSCFYIIYHMDLMNCVFLSRPEYLEHSILDILDSPSNETKTFVPANPAQKVLGIHYICFIYFFKYFNWLCFCIFVFHTGDWTIWNNWKASGRKTFDLSENVIMQV